GGGRLHSMWVTPMGRGCWAGPMCPCSTWTPAGRSVNSPTRRSPRARRRSCSTMKTPGVTSWSDSVTRAGGVPSSRSSICRNRSNSTPALRSATPGSDMPWRSAANRNAGCRHWTKHRLSPRDPFLAIYAPIVQYMALFALKRYEETIAVCRATAALHPHHAGAWRLMTVSLGLLGRIDEAREALAHTLTMQPDLSSAHVADNTVYADPADRSRFLEGLRKAGLKD